MAWTAVETPNAKYILLFSHHWKTLEYSPMKFDALVLEEISENKEQFKGLNLRKDAQYKRLVAQAIETKKPVWIVDSSLSPASKLRRGRGESVTAISTALGGLGLGLVALDSIAKRKISRRDLLTAGISVGLLSPLLNRLGRLPLMLSEKSIKHPKVWGLSAKISEIESGEGYIKIRNALAAEKAETFLAQSLRKELGRKPVIAMAWGSAHFGVLDFLKFPEKRQRLLKETNLDKYLQGDYPTSFKLHLDRGGKIKKIEKFPSTLKSLQKPARREKLSRRDFFKAAFSRRFA